MLPTYAMTEALPICANPRERTRRKLASVGPAAGPEVGVSSYSSDGSPGLLNLEGAPGVEGEVLVRGACVFGGYEPRAHLGYDPNLEAFYPGGWLRTGDKGWLDSEGYLHLTGRFKEVISGLPLSASLLLLLWSLSHSECPPPHLIADC